MTCWLARLDGRQWERRVAAAGTSRFLWQSAHRDAEIKQELSAVLHDRSALSFFLLFGNSKRAKISSRVRRNEWTAAVVGRSLPPIAT